MSRGLPDSVTEGVALHEQGKRVAFPVIVALKLSVLWAMLQREMRELDAALMAPESDEAIVLECADVANLAMMIADVLMDLTRDKEIKSESENRVAVGADEGDGVADAGNREGALRRADGA